MDLSAVFGAAFAPLYQDAILHRATLTDDGMGGGSQSFADEPVKAQLDSANEAMRGQQGYTDTDQRILVLASGIDRPSADDEITVGGRRWKIANVASDPANAAWDLRGVRA